MCTARAEALDFGRPRPRRRGRPAFYRGRPPDAGSERTGSVGGSSNRLLRDRDGRLAYADGGDDRGEQAKYGEGVEPAAEAAGGVLEPADDWGAGAAAQDADRVDPGDAARQGRPGQEYRRQREEMSLRRVEADRGDRQPQYGPVGVADQPGDHAAHGHSRAGGGQGPPPLVLAIGITAPGDHPDRAERVWDPRC